jgi:hypothetical protein
LDQAGIVDGTTDVTRQTSIGGTLDWMAAQLTKRSTAPRIITFELDGADHHIYPWMSVPIDCAPLANLTGNVLVQSVTIEGAASRGPNLTMSVTAVEGNVLGYDWRDFWRSGGGVSSGSIAITGGGTSGGGSGSTVVPIRIHLGGTNTGSQASTAGAFVDAAEAIPLVSSAYLAGTYTLRVPAMVRPTTATQIEVSLWNVTTNTSAGSVTTNSTSFTTGTTSVTLDSTSTYLLKTKVTGTGAGVVGHSVLESN